MLHFRQPFRALYAWPDGVTLYLPKIRPAGAEGAVRIAAVGLGLAISVRYVAAGVAAAYL